MQQSTSLLHKSYSNFFHLNKTSGRKEMLEKKARKWHWALCNPDCVAWRTFKN
jgi:hypothetical protein